MMEAYRNKEANEQGTGGWFLCGRGTLVFGRIAASFIKERNPSRRGLLKVVMTVGYHF